MLIANLVPLNVHCLQANLQREQAKKKYPATAASRGPDLRVPSLPKQPVKHSVAHLIATTSFSFHFEQQCLYLGRLRLLSLAAN